MWPEAAESSAGVCLSRLLLGDLDTFCQKLSVEARSGTRVPPDFSLFTPKMCQSFSKLQQDSVASKISFLPVSQIQFKNFLEK